MSRVMVVVVVLLLISCAGGPKPVERERVIESFPEFNVRYQIKDSIMEFNISQKKKVERELVEGEKVIEKKEVIDWFTPDIQSLEIEVYGKGFSAPIADGLCSFKVKEIIEHCYPVMLREKKFPVLIKNIPQFPDPITMIDGEDGVIQLVSAALGIPFEKKTAEELPYLIATAYVEQVKPGETARILCEIENIGKGDAYQLIARFQSPCELFNGWILLFGTVASKQKIARELNIQVPADFQAKLIPVTIVIEDYGRRVVEQKIQLSAQVKEE